MTPAKTADYIRRFRSCKMPPSPNRPLPHALLLTALLAAPLGCGSSSSPAAASSNPDASGDGATLHPAGASPVVTLADGQVSLEHAQAVVDGVAAPSS